MTLLKTALLPLALLAVPVSVPATAQSLSDTHEMRWAPAGKTPMVTYHPLKRDCRPAGAPPHLSGKTPHMAPTAASKCNSALARADTVRAARD